MVKKLFCWTSLEKVHGAEQTRGWYGSLFEITRTGAHALENKRAMPMAPGTRFLDTNRQKRMRPQRVAVPPSGGEVRRQHVYTVYRGCTTESEKVWRGATAQPLTESSVSNIPSSFVHRIHGLRSRRVSTHPWAPGPILPLPYIFKSGSTVQIVAHTNGTTDRPRRSNSNSSAATNPPQDCRNTAS